VRRAWCGDFVGSWPAVVFTFAWCVVYSGGAARCAGGAGSVTCLVRAVKDSGNRGLGCVGTLEAGSLARRGLSAGLDTVALTRTQARGGPAHNRAARAAVPGGRPCEDREMAGGRGGSGASAYPYVVGAVTETSALPGST